MQQLYSDLKDTDNIKVYQGSITNTAIMPTYIWKKPRDCQIVYIYAVGGGGGGGGGLCQTKPTNTYNCGGSGGGAGGSYVSLIPANLLPDILYVSPGYGGSGSPGGSYGSTSFTNSTGGGSSRVTFAAPANGTFDDSWNGIVIAYGGNGGANGSSNGTSPAGLAADTAGGLPPGATGGAFPASTRIPNFLAIDTASGGPNGLGYNIRNVTSTSYSTNLSFLPSGMGKNIICTGGTAGGAAFTSTSSFPGGDILLNNTILSSLYAQFSAGVIPGGPSGVSGNLNGSNGIGYGMDLTDANNINTLNLFHPLFFTGGTGGGGCYGSSGDGGNGGHGGLGCGGGGGGGSNGGSGNKGGAGGNGGPGFVIIIAI